MRSLGSCAALLACLGSACSASDAATEVTENVGELDPVALSATVPNDFPFLNPAGTAATVSATGSVDLENAFHTAQGQNGRSCASCHLVQAGWSIRPIDVEVLFWLSAGKAPIFNLLDANSPTADVSSVAARHAAYSMLRKGLFRRGGAVPANAEYEIVAVDDPLGAGGSLTRFEAFRRPLATANFHIARNIGWHDQNTNGTGDVHTGLVAQATGNITGSQQGAAPSSAVVAEIVAFEEGLSFAQTRVLGVGSLTTCGARGGAANLAARAPTAGRFDLFDAWLGLAPGACTTPAADKKRAQIARGQELFNNPNPGGGSCQGCHDAANNGSNTNGLLFDIGASRAPLREAGMPLYTIRNKSTLEERQTTDPGRAIRSGRWVDVDRFKVPSLRGLAARPPYFHNGVAKTLDQVVRHYEESLGFVFTPAERRDLVAFLEAL